jgi:hypothetical protein
MNKKKENNIYVIVGFIFLGWMIVTNFKYDNMNYNIVALKKYTYEISNYISNIINTTI